MSKRIRKLLLALAACGMRRAGGGRIGVRAVAAGAEDIRDPGRGRHGPGPAGRSDHAGPADKADPAEKPGIDGFETCRRVRADGIWTPVLMVTARGRLADRVAGLDGGADDYLTKPVPAGGAARPPARAGPARPAQPPDRARGRRPRLDPATRGIWRRGTRVELSRNASRSCWN